jgi:hypothetical protein
MDLGRILRAAEALANIGQAVWRARAPGTGVAARGGEPPLQDLATGTRLFGQMEARLAGVLVSALREAFDRDRAHLEMEREQIDQERRRAEELLRLELLRQAGERELAGIRSAIVVTLVVWITSVLFTMVQRGGPGIAGLVLLAIGWALLLGSLALSFAAYRRVAGLLARGAREPLDITGLARQSLAPAAPWLIVLGLACIAASLLVRLLPG